MRPLPVLIVGLLACASLGNSLAQSPQDIQAPAESSAYLQDSRGTVLRSGAGLCWRLGEWTPVDAVAGCDGALTPPIVKATAPAISPPAGTESPAPAPAPIPCDLQVVLTDSQAFAFDRATLSDSARRHLDQEFFSKLGHCSLTAIAVTGHTDRLGSAPYNQRLSEKRAEAVAAYLHERGTDAAISAVGVGSAQAVNECASSLSGAALRSCLQPNRRVVIQAQGVRQ